MSQQTQQLIVFGVLDVDAVGADYGAQVLAELRSIRMRIVELWKERGVTLTPEEQKQLHAEIRETCALLTDLTATV